MNKFYGPVGVGITLCMSTALLAQEQPNRPTGTQSPSTSTPATPRDNARADGDQILVQWLLVDNENEIELSRLAVSKATAPEVKQFAQKMIDDHTQFVQKLQQFAGRSATGMNPTDRGATGREVARGTGNTGGTGTGNTGGTGTGNTAGTGNTGTGGTGNTGTGNTGTGTVGQGNTGRDPKGEFPATGRTGTPQDASASRSGGTIDHERLIKDLGRQCLESHTKMLNEKQGAEFDRCYMNMMLGAHVKMVDTVEVFRNHASPALRPTLDEGLRTVQMHLQHAKDLAKRTDQLTNTGK